MAAAVLESALLLAAGCTKHEQPQRETERIERVALPRASAAQPPRPRPHRPYNVLLITIDALRADMPWERYPRNIAPWMTRFEKRCTDFKQAYSLSSYTAKSVAPMLVDKYPSEMKRNGYYFTKWLHQNLFISERAERAGDHTLSGQAHGYFLPTYGLNQGFEDYRLLPGTVLETTGVSTVTSKKLNRLAKKMLSVPHNVSQASCTRATRFTATSVATATTTKCITPTAGLVTSSTGRSSNLGASTPR